MLLNCTFLVKSGTIKWSAKERKRQSFIDYVGEDGDNYDDDDDDEKFVTFNYS